jgi:hypothetical protein
MMTEAASVIQRHSIRRPVVARSAHTEPILSRQGYVAVLTHSRLEIRHWGTNSRLVPQYPPNIQMYA